MASSQGWTCPIVTTLPHCGYAPDTNHNSNEKQLGHIYYTLPASIQLLNNYILL